MKTAFLVLAAGLLGLFGFLFVTALGEWLFANHVDGFIPYLVFLFGSIVLILAMQIKKRL